MRHLAALGVGALIGLAATAGLSYALIRWGDCALIDIGNAPQGRVR